MIRFRGKYFFFTMLTAFCLSAKGQYTAAVDSTNTTGILIYYHSSKEPKATRTYLHLDYTRPNNQLMSWPDYPLTAYEIEHRDRRREQENKISNKIAKDIITSLLHKKKKAAVIPTY